jgi:hypothetical protein
VGRHANNGPSAIQKVLWPCSEAFPTRIGFAPRGQSRRSLPLCVGTASHRSLQEVKRAPFGFCRIRARRSLLYPARDWPRPLGPVDRFRTSVSGASTTDFQSGETRGPRARLWRPGSPPGTVPPFLLRRPGASGVERLQAGPALGLGLIPLSVAMEAAQVHDTTPLSSSASRGIAFGRTGWGPAATAVVGDLALPLAPWLMGNHSAVGLHVDRRCGRSLGRPPWGSPRLQRAPHGSAVPGDGARIHQADCGNVAVALAEGSLEYPLWAFLFWPGSSHRVAGRGRPSAHHTDPYCVRCAIVGEKCPESRQSVRDLPGALSLRVLRPISGQHPEPADSRPKKL